MSEIEFQNRCQIECQKICKIECQHACKIDAFWVMLNIYAGGSQQVLTISRIYLV